eukprot:GILK01016673.1.p1 GENE.GILK01016673.1~~GILK01016673.1.p1  ORF type:complete len:136 (+),score=4.25 GILK01016673.1:138-545(+)
MLRRCFSARVLRLAHEPKTFFRTSIAAASTRARQNSVDHPEPARHTLPLEHDPITFQVTESETLVMPVEELDIEEVELVGPAGTPEGMFTPESAEKAGVNLKKDFVTPEEQFTIPRNVIPADFDFLSGAGSQIIG